MRNPRKAPKSIRGYIRKKSELINRKDIEKIRVCVAPSFDECEWYINQRHASSTMQKAWSRHQQQRWIVGLYDKYNGDIEKVMSITRLNKGQLEFTLRIIKIRDFALAPLVLNKLSADEQESVRSHRIPMTIFERWFFNPVIKEKWGIEFDNDNINIISNRQSFLFAYAKWVKLVLHRDEPEVLMQINTRTITSNFKNILNHLPSVSFKEEYAQPDKTGTDGSSGTETQSPNKPEESHTGDEETKGNTNNKRPISKNPDRNQLVIESCHLKVSNYKLDALFREFKKIPVYRYKNCVAASLRVFLDLAVYEYIISEDCKEDICKVYKDQLFNISLKKRLEYLKKNKLSARTPAYKVVEKLLNHSNHYSLDILNTYIHGSDTHHTDRRFLNGFWDFLYPLFNKIMDIREN